MENRFIKHSKVQFPIICGAMYPCSNPELVAAASEGGGIAILQPVSLTFVHGYDLREGIKSICKLYPESYWRNLDRKREYPSDFVNPITPALEELYALALALPSLPDTDAIFTILP